MALSTLNARRGTRRVRERGAGGSNIETMRARRPTRGDCVVVTRTKMPGEHAAREGGAVSVVALLARGLTERPSLVRGGTPRRGRRRHNAAERELDAEPSVGPFAAQRIRKPLVIRHDLNGPHVRARRRNERGRLRVRVELLPRGGAGVARVSTILSHRILAPIRMPVIVLQPKSLLRAREDPGPRPVLAHVKRNSNLAGCAASHVHRHLGAAEHAVRGRSLGQLPPERLAAERLKLRPEGIARIHRLWLRVRSRSTAEREIREGHHKAESNAWSCHLHLLVKTVAIPDSTKVVVLPLPPQIDTDTLIG